MQKDIQNRMLRWLVEYGYEYETAYQIAMFDVKRALGIINKIKKQI